MQHHTLFKHLILAASPNSVAAECARLQELPDWQDLAPSSWEPSAPEEHSHSPSTVPPEWVSLGAADVREDDLAKHRDRNRAAQKRFRCGRTSAACPQAGLS